MINQIDLLSRPPTDTLKPMQTLQRKLGLLSCTLLVAGNMIGIGIFVTAGRITTTLPHPGLIMTAWLLGGLLSIAGGLAYAELATRFPRAGGGYIYLREAMGPVMGFLSGFSASMITIPGTAAFLAMGFARYAGIDTPWIAKVIGISLILSISYVNHRGVVKGAGLQDLFMILKLTLITTLVLAGFGIGAGNWAHFAIHSPLPQASWIALPLALVPIMYTYSGWDATVYMAQEVTNPREVIPKSLIMGASLVTVVYMLLAGLYIYGLPVTHAIGKARIIVAVSSALFSPAIGTIVGSLVAVSVLGCLSATILTGPRVIYAMAKDHLLPQFANQVHPKFGTPSNAIWLHAIWACVLLITGTFDQLLDYITVPSVLFAALNVAGLFVSRFRKAQDPNAIVYLTWGYPFIPALFVMTMLGIVINTALHDPQNSLWGIAMVVIGIPIYFLNRRFTN
ncbi:amino acid permease [bacterium]|nr:amino acid permease [bacterium]